MNEIFANFLYCITKNLEARIRQKKIRLLTENLAECSCQRFLEVGGAIAFQTSTYEFEKI